MSQSSDLLSKEPINLSDLATISYEPSRNQYENWRKIPDSLAPDFILTTKQDGSPLQCQPVLDDLDAALADALCGDLLAKATINILDGYELGGRAGIVLVSKQPFVALDIAIQGSEEPPSPFLFELGYLREDMFLDYEPLTAEEKARIEHGVPTMKPLEATPKYPYEAIREKSQGKTGVLLGVGVDGSVLSCRVVQSAGNVVLDAEGCRFALKNISFEPAKDAELGASPRSYTTVFNWVLDK